MANQPQQDVRDFANQLRSQDGQTALLVSSALETIQQHLDMLSASLGTGSTASSSTGAMYSVTFASTIYPPLGVGTVLITLESDIIMGRPSGTDGEIEIILVQDSTGGHNVTWNEDYFGVNLDIDTSPSTYSTFHFKKRMDNKWALVRVIQTGLPWA